jgi:hypothetical protein
MNEEFKFPDEIEEENKGKLEDKEEDFSFEIEDDTPPEDRNIDPIDADTVKELEEDDLQSYSKKVKTRIDQMKKVWHDERRAKESALREQQEAVALAQRMMEENRRLKSTLSEGEKQYVSTAQSAAELELEAAKRAYRDAYDSGESDQIAEAQQKLTEASIKQDRVKNYRPSLQEEENEVKIPQQTYQQQEQPKIDPVTAEWLEKNTWYGPDEEMTALALGTHTRLEKEFGKSYIGTKEYFKRIDETMRKRFPENFSDEVETQTRGDKPSSRNESKSSSVVAPATRSTASKRIVLKTSQVALAKKLGLTPEQYAREMQKLEK